MSFLHFLASFFGYVGAALLFIQVVFGTRHVFSLFTRDTVLMNRLHKYFGQYGTWFVFLHPLFEMMYRDSSILWLFLPSFSFSREVYISLGRFALFLAIIIYVTSAIVRQKMKWRPWKYVHLLSYPLVILTFFHVPHIGTLFEEYPAIQYVWYALFFIFIIVCLYRFCLFAGFFKEKGTIMSSGVEANNILVVSVSLPLSLPAPLIGQHVYLQIKRFSSEHPFTVMEYDEERRVMTFGMRMGGPFVAEMAALKQGGEVYVDGPYGTFTEEGQNKLPKVIIAGGVGVTPFVRLVSSYGQNTTFLYCNRSVSDALRRDLIKQKVTSYVDIVDDGTGGGDNTVIGRIGPEIAKSKSPAGEVLYFICGSPVFTGIVKKILLDMNIKKSHIFFEELGF